jgi:hypothetical protein
MDHFRLSRRAILGCAPAAGLWAQSPATPSPEKLPPLPGALVKEFVMAGHTNLPKTKSLLGEQPKLLNATWDWTNGDFETALGGASHMGNREIALFLLSQGARLDIFAAAMLGRLDIVRSAVEAFPGIQRSLGPHGITLLSHAEMGGSEAAEVAVYLKTLG